MKKGLRGSLVLARRLVGCLAFVVALAAFSGWVPWVGWLMRFHVATSWLGMLSLCTVGVIATFAFIVVATLLLGRVYCSVLCPLGLLQDFIHWASRRKSQKLFRLGWLRGLVFGFVFGLSLFGWALGFRLLEPYSSLGRVLALTSLPGVAMVLVVLGLSLWRQRLFCNSLCPVGTFLGWISGLSPLKLRISESCVGCGKCAKVCNAGCIDVEGKRIDNGRCVRCLNCISSCPTRAIAWGLKPKQAPMSVPNRRDFLMQCGFSILGLCIGGALSGAVGRLAHSLAEVSKEFVLPPGAGDADRLARLCTACGLCVANCPTNVIVLKTGGLPHLDFAHGNCQFDCNRCSSICPTGALKPLDLATKHRTRIGQVVFNAKVCKVFSEEEPCGKCAEACKIEAVVLRKTTGAPRFKRDQCIGCGSCVNICPTKALEIKVVESQTLLEQG
ncbi:MAG: 4Fe-4S binding protein [Lentisphaerae bacterium]|jgi:ferredoxin-type protein NapF|nr:4Fe-4S binding protein [Lentisphaerota bacterium]